MSHDFLIFCASFYHIQDPIYIAICMDHLGIYSTELGNMTILFDHYRKFLLGVGMAEWEGDHFMHEFLNVRYFYFFFV